jgi:Helix-destabilising protein
MSIRFEVKSPEVKEKRGTAKASGKPFLIREQSVYFPIAGEPYPTKAVINLGDLAPLEPATYEVGPECVYIKRYGEVAVDLTRARKVPGGK